MDIDDVLASHEEQLMAVPGVVGVGVAEVDGRPAIRVMLESVTPETDALPDQLDGVPVVTEFTGEISAFGQ